jgi:hypothetical protein
MEHRGLVLDAEDIARGQSGAGGIFTLVEVHGCATLLMEARQEDQGIE